MWLGTTNQASLPETINIGEFFMNFFYMQTEGHHQRVYIQREKDPGVILQLIRG